MAASSGTLLKYFKYPVIESEKTHISSSDCCIIDDVDLASCATKRKTNEKSDDDSGKRRKLSLSALRTKQYSNVPSMHNEDVSIKLLDLNLKDSTDAKIVQPVSIKNILSRNKSSKQKYDQDIGDLEKCKDIKQGTVSKKKINIISDEEADTLNEASMDVNDVLCNGFQNNKVIKPARSVKDVLINYKQVADEKENKTKNKQKRKKNSKTSKIERKESADQKSSDNEPSTSCYKNDSGVIKSSLEDSMDSETSCKIANTKRNTRINVLLDSDEDVKSNKQNSSAISLEKIDLNTSRRSGRLRKPIERYITEYSDDDGGTGV